ncbi:antitrypsin-like isoform 6-T6 [Cochliomyia hominivorax]
MIMKAKILRLLWLFTFLFLILPSPSLSARQPKNMPLRQNQFNRGLETFGIRLFSELALTNRQKNIVFSPFSIQTCIAMARMGAVGKTALEIDEGLALSPQDPEDMAKNYHSVLAAYENSPILKIANKIYVMEGYEIRETFNELLTKQFFSSVDVLNFRDGEASAKAINSWVENKTNHLIKDLVPPSALNDLTRLVLVNAIHFKGEWVNKFQESDTRERDFYLDETNTVKVQMMHINKRFNYGEFPELDATALEMPYKDSDLSMLIILPNSRTGLVNLEENLKNVSLPSLTRRMYPAKVIVDMPKFKAEFEVELTEPLKKMGMSRMFTGEAEFDKMLKSQETLQVSKVIHKAFIEVNEQGTEAAAATAMIMLGRSRALFVEPPETFNVNKPFYYTLMNQNGLVIFKGNIKHV